MNKILRSIGIVSVMLGCTLNADAQDTRTVGEIEDAVVGTYQKIEDKFVGKFIEVEEGTTEFPE